MKTGAGARILGDLLFAMACVLLVPIPVSLLYDAWDMEVLGRFVVPSMAVVFASCALLVAALAQVLRMLTHRHAGQDVAETAAYVTIAGGWFVATIVGALPFLSLLAPIDAWFEAMSGLTATGATVISGLDAVTPSLLFYRSLLQFCAGFAFIVVSLALLSRLTHGGAHLLASDEGTASTRLRTNIEETSHAIWSIYLGLGAVALVGYLFSMRFHAGMPWKPALFDAAVHAGSTVSAGGFSSHDASFAYYQSWAVELVAVIVMLAAGTSYALMFQARRRPDKLFRDSEWRFYLAVVLLGGLAASGLLMLAGQATVGALRGALFTVVSIGTSTGFVTVDHDQWPTLARSVLLVAMFTGAMAGSVSGGMKILRVMLLLKVARRETRKLLHPRAIMTVRHHGRSVSEQTLLTIVAFFFAYISIWMIGAIVLTALESQLGVFEGAAAAAAAIGNVGPAMGIVGPFDTYGGLRSSSKVLLGLLMWIGRLEVFAVLLLLTPNSWR